MRFTTENTYFIANKRKTTTTKIRRSTNVYKKKYELFYLYRFSFRKKSEFVKPSFFRHSTFFHDHIRILKLFIKEMMLRIENYIFR